MTKSVKNTRAILAFLFSIVLFDMMGSTILLTVQAFIVKEYNTTALAVSLLVVIYAACMFFAAPILGRISDRYGRRPILVISFIGSAIGYFIFGIGGALWILYISRAIDGFTGGNMAIVQSYLSDISNEDNKTRNFGLFGAATALGLIMGPVFGGLLSQISLNTPVFVAGTFALIEIVLCLILLPESLPLNKRNHKTIKLGDINPFRAIGKMLRRPIIGGLLIISGITEFIFDGVNINIPVYLIHKFNISPLELGFLMIISGITLIIIQGGLIGILSKKFKEKTLISMGFIIMAASLVLFTYVTSLWMIYVIAVTISIGLGLILPVLSALLSNNTRSDEQGEMFGVNSSLLGLMAALGPLFAGLAYDLIVPNATFWIGAILLLLSLVFISRLKIIKTQSTDNESNNG